MLQCRVRAARVSVEQLRLVAAPVLNHVAVVVNVVGNLDLHL